MVRMSGQLMALRKASPAALRRVYRLARSAWESPRKSPIVPAFQFEGARYFANRRDLVTSLPPGGRVLEVGTDTGAFARVILAAAEPQGLDVIDVDFSRFDPALKEEPRITCHEGRSADIMAGFEPASFDWVYVDASHRYEDVVADAAAARRIVRPGGFLVFNDYAHIDPWLGRFGVHLAVSEFLVESGWAIHGLAHHPAGLYDIAIRAPGPA